MFCHHGKCKRWVVTSRALIGPDVMLTRLPSTQNPNYWLIYWLIVSQLLCEEILITVFSFLCLWQIPDEFDRGECEHTDVTDGYLFTTSLCFHNVWRQISCSPLLKLLFKCLFRVLAWLVLFASLCLISIFLISPGCRDVSSVTGCCRLLCFEFPRVLENLENIWPVFQSWKILCLPGTLFKLSQLLSTVWY